MATTGEAGTHAISWVRSKKFSFPMAGCIAMAMSLSGSTMAYAPATPLLHAVTPRLAVSGRHAVSPLMQQGPLEEGFKELMPMSTDEGNVDPELVKRVDAEVFELTGVGLDELLNPSKVVNYEREVILLEQQVCTRSPPPHPVA